METLAQADNCMKYLSMASAVENEHTYKIVGEDESGEWHTYQCGINALQTIKEYKKYCPPFKLISCKLVA